MNIRKRIIASVLALSLLAAASVFAGAEGSTATRAEAVSELYALAGTPAFMNDNIFTDVPSGSAAEKAIVWANGKGIINGYGDGSFGPDNPITREQLITILWRYAQYKEYDVSVGEETNILSYDDAFDISSYAVSAFQWACGEGIAEESDLCLKPLAALTPAEVKNTIARFAYIYSLTSLTPDKTGWAANTERGAVYMPDSAKSAFDLANGKLDGAQYTALAYLGSQVVSGANYAYLCKVNPVTPNDAEKLAVVKVYKNHFGDADITGVTDISIGDYTEGSAVTLPAISITGGWHIWNESTGLIPKKANAAFNEATESIADVIYNPAVLLGTKMGDGTNYAFLCAASDTSAERTAVLAVVIVNVPENGVAAVSSVADFAI